MSYQGESVIDAFHSRNTIYDVLESFGYTATGDDWYKHPNNGGNDHSVHILNDHFAHFFSPNDPMGTGSASAFGVYCKLRYGGDASRAVKDLAREYGMERRRDDDLIWPDSRPLLTCR